MTMKMIKRINTLNARSGHGSYGQVRSFHWPNMKLWSVFGSVSRSWSQPRSIMGNVFRSEMGRK